MEAHAPKSDPPPAFATAADEVKAALVDVHAKANAVAALAKQVNTLTNAAFEMQKQLHRSIAAGRPPSPKTMEVLANLADEAIRPARELAPQLEIAFAAGRHAVEVHAAAWHAAPRKRESTA